MSLVNDTSDLSKFTNEMLKEKLCFLWIENYDTTIPFKS